LVWYSPYYFFWFLVLCCLSGEDHEVEIDFADFSADLGKGLEILESDYSRLDNHIKAPPLFTRRV
jgi:hypothetical protein